MTMNTDLVAALSVVCIISATLTGSCRQMQ